MLVIILKNFSTCFGLVEPSLGQIQDTVLVHSASTYTMGSHIVNTLYWHYRSCFVLLGDVFKIYIQNLLSIYLVKILKMQKLLMYYKYNRGTRWRSWLRHCATSRKVASSIPDSIIEYFHCHNTSGRTMALWSTLPLTEMSTKNVSWG